MDEKPKKSSHLLTLIATCVLILLARGGDDLIKLGAKQADEIPFQSFSKEQVPPQPKPKDNEVLKEAAKSSAEEGGKQLAQDLLKKAKSDDKDDEE